MISAAVAAALTGVFSSCDSLIYDDLDPCDEGLRLRFVYDYNMEFANAFPSQVDCLTLLIYDSEGRYLATRTETAAALLSDENWRMDIDLDPGTYNLIAYGGMVEPEASFAFSPQPGAATPMENVDVYLPSSLITDPVGTRLHDLFYGALTVTVPENTMAYTEATVEMMKDTNNVRIVLQNVDGSPVDNADFDFTVTADNTRFNYLNEVIPTSTSTFYPWARGNETVTSYYSDSSDTDMNIQVAYVEFSLSRFVSAGQPHLTITRKSDGQTVISIPLASYLLLLKSQIYADMPSQEFLDRESRWNVVFFLSGGNWLRTQIIVNGWTVRINTTGL